MTDKNDICPDCKSPDLVMAMSSGKLKAYGCLKCSNAQGLHRKISDAKKAWKEYKDSKWPRLSR